MWCKKVRDTLRFHRVWNEDPNQTEVLRFKRLVISLVQSPFIPEGTIDKHLSSYAEKYPDEVVEIRDDLYVDDPITSGKLWTSGIFKSYSNRNIS